MNPINLAQSLISNLNPTNYKTPVIGPIRQAIQGFTGKPNYSPQAIAMALGVHGGGGFGTFGKGVNTTIPARFLTRDRLVSQEGAVDKARVNHYVNQIWQGKPIDPLKVVQQAKGLFGILNGEHRFEAMKNLNIRDFPVQLVKRGESGYK